MTNEENLRKKFNSVITKKAWGWLDTDSGTVAYIEGASLLLPLVLELNEALKLAEVRLGILTARMRSCHEATGKHELLGEAECFVSEARKIRASVDKFLAGEA